MPTPEGIMPFLDELQFAYIQKIMLWLEIEGQETIDIRRVKRLKRLAITLAKPTSNVSQIIVTLALYAGG
jgi:hypothetical protein